MSPKMWGYLIGFVIAVIMALALFRYPIRLILENTLL